MIALGVYILWHSFCWAFGIGFAFIIFGWLIKGFFALIK